MNPFLELLEMRLRTACTFSFDVDNVCTFAALEHLAAGGSRVRARICHDASVRLGLSKDDAICAASVCELLHNASLIQDDLLDRTTLRRGVPSVWVKHGDTIAVCCGDLMLSAAYGLLCQLEARDLVPGALRLVHQRTTEVILGEAANISTRQASGEGSVAHYERLAKAKSASLLSLSLELPLFLSGNEAYLTEAHAVASDFAVAYQVADDLADVVQDTQEGSSNLLLSLIERDGLTIREAYDCAVRLATVRLRSTERRASLLPHGCAATLMLHSEKLKQTLTEYPVTAFATAGV